MFIFTLQFLNYFLFETNTQAYLFLCLYSSSCSCSTSEDKQVGGLMCATLWTLPGRQAYDVLVHITPPLMEGKQCYKLLYSECYQHDPLMANSWKRVENMQSICFTRCRYFKYLRTFWNIFFPSSSAVISMTSLISDSVCVIFPPLGAGFHTVQIISSFSLCNFNFPSLILHSSLCPPSMSQQLSEVIFSILQGSLVTERNLFSLPTSLGPWRPVRTECWCNFIPFLSGEMKDREGQRHGSAFP